MRRNSWWFTVVFAVLGCTLQLSVAHAQQVKPYFLVIVDTSGSMAWCSGGTQDNPNADCSCYAGNACGGTYNTNRCGMSANKIGDAKCALQRIVDGVGGDAVFGLMQFQRPCAGCSNAISCASSSDCKDGQLDVAIDEGNAALMREWVDNQNQGTCDANSHQAIHELSTGQWTPLALSLQRANEYLRGMGANVPYATGDSSAPGSPIPESADNLRCRPVSVILLTDGDDTCASDPTNDPPARAKTLNTGATDATTRAGKAFHTYVIGFGASQGNFKPAVLDNIATQGGTDSHDSSGHKYFPAMNEEQLSIALNKIIADAQPPVETCNGMDDDCDGNTDEGLPKFCNKPAGIDDRVLCDEPKETKCDGMDDDCDGVIDEGLTNACGSCGDVPKEVCDGFDNDCDQRIDEDTTSNESCGNDKGECQAGKLVCTGGTEQCKGEITGSAEVCDCKDNDCDGNVDEEGSDKLCPNGQRCAGCRCVEFCKQTTEFLPVCPNGLAAEFQPNGECLCIVDNCDHDACSKSTRESGGDVECAPNNAKVAACQCSAGACVSICNGKNCGSGKTCNPKDGRCVEDNCRGLGCTNNEICDPGTGRCEKDACATTTCQSDQVCRGGKCESSCAKVTCGDGQTCKSGECQDDKCASVSCSGLQACDPLSGECVTDRCSSKSCATGQVCSVNSGNCEAEPCWDVKCPANQVCISGECQSAPTSGSNGEAGSGSEPVKAASRLLATGGGGCACSVPGGTAPHSAPLRGLAAMLGMLLGVVFLQRRRLQRTAAVRSLMLLAFVLALATLGGCKVSPICIDCIDAALTEQPDANSDNPQGGGQGGSGGAANGGAGGKNATDAGTANDAEVDSSTGDSGTKCMPPGTPEICNDKDDDCDFKVDEEVVPTSNTCNQTGVCAGTTPVCANGSFACRFPATYEMDETSCDGLDNDCDGKVDEGFPMLGTPCDVGTGACKATGTFHCSSTGKGMSCDATPMMPGDEVCNGKDDDCDGMVDEPKDSPGTNPSYVKDALVQVRSDLWIYQYEASRVDADDKKPGIVTTRTCSRAGVLPWTNVTYTEAVDACKSVNMTLCSLDDWMFACQSGTSCKWAVPSCNNYDNGTCNGHDPNAQPGDPDTDSLKATGSASGCYADFAGAGHVFDMSGNAKEWSTGPNSPATNPLRGGSYNNDAESLSCTFDFTLGQADLRLPNIGFRCCSNTAP